MKHGGTNWAEDVSVDFSDNLNPIGPPLELTKLVKEAVKRGVYLKFPANLAEETLSQFEKLPVVVFNGATEATLTLLASLRARRLITRVMEYTDYARIAVLLGIPHLTDVEKASEGDVVIMSNPNNPTGRYTPRDVLLDLSTRLEKRGAKLVVDESFIDFCKCPTAAPDVLVVKSYGKLLAAPGLRVGAVIGVKKRELKAPWRINSIADYAIYKLGARALEKHREKTVEYIVREMPRVWQAIAKCRELESTDVHFFVIYGPPPDELRIRTLEDRGVNGFRVSIKTPELNNLLIKAVCGV